MIWLAAWPLAMFGARLPLGRFTRAIAPSQAVAFSTQSSLATPAGDAARGGADRTCRWRRRASTLPMAVAVFRATGPAMNLAVAIYIAYWFGVELTPAQMAVGVAAAATTTMGAVGIPGQASFVTSIAPICIAMGLPIEPLALLIAVEVLPDIVRTRRQCQHGRRASATARADQRLRGRRKRSREQDTAARRRGSAVEQPTQPTSG